jgi:hypothetical protein
MIPKFNSLEEKFTFLKANKQLIINAKKSAIKHADAISYSIPCEYTKGKTTKIIAKLIDLPEDIESILAKVVINTTNIIDSHDDCHIPGLWKKSLSEMKNTYLLKEHQMKFDSVITDNIKAYTKGYSFSELGFPEYKGNTEALIFDASISRERNEFMFNQYANGWVKEHSVGMQYVQLLMCINSTDKRYSDEKANWDKYYPIVVNKEVAEEEGYFFAVTEAKIIEGSAVLRGSNSATPTLIVEPSTADTQQQQAAKALEKKRKEFFINLKS